MTEDKKIRVLIVDDSPTARILLKTLISEDKRLEVAGIVSNGAEAISFLERERPDVISMDIFMPVMDGLEATRHIMASCPVPIVIVSSEYNAGENQLSFKALEAGALTILPRPVGPGHPEYIRQGKTYRSTLRSIAEVKVIKRIRKGIRVPRLHPDSPTEDQQTTFKKPGTETGRIVVIGASAGGPSALQTILKSMPAVFPVPVIIVQHIDKGFADGFARWLELSSGKPIRVPSDREPLLPGSIYLPPADRHLGVREEAIAMVSDDPPESGLRPSVNYLFRTTAKVYGARSVAILLSGMGQDGAAELKHLKEIGAYTLVQDMDTSLVYGMPGEAVRIGAACHVVPPDQMIPKIINHLSPLNK